MWWQSRFLFEKNAVKQPLLTSKQTMRRVGCIVLLLLLIFFMGFNRFDYNKINTIISFGDSYTTRYLDMDSLTYACRNCTSAGGPNWVVYLTDTTEWISWNFAYNSAPVSNHLVNQTSTVTDMRIQVQALYPRLFVSPNERTASIIQKVYGNKKRTAQSTLVTFWVGINDIDLTYDWEDTTDLDVRIMNRYAYLVEQLIQQGERQFMFINVPPIDRAPLWYHTLHKQRIHKRVLEFNHKLTRMIHSLRKTHPHMSWIEYDAWGLFHTLLDNPDKYNITNIDSFCPDWEHPIERECKPIEEYFWLNDLHPTFHVHRMLAEDIQKIINK
ncbi:uncharacterized protein B0P05DRAFT_524787 [Gilbertella persicaria]|uniref:uncharacterized protein n=1 Tax=Gilbertella persicaria TaxID=101096 RepID=UPI00221FDD90|nr:uncharacterized protein B0P05DRAFT_524787 [Gilbertella persicaria]KAI8095120.1 hypothetical protein B0P05DRAFT_524787 [Gilbertella persicaria]